MNRAFYFILNNGVERIKKRPEEYCLVGLGTPCRSYRRLFSLVTLPLTTPTSTLPAINPAGVPGLPENGNTCTRANPIALQEVDWRREGKCTVAEVTLIINGETQRLEGKGNGSLSAVSEALQKTHPEQSFRFEDYMQHAIEDNSDARAAAYVKISDQRGKPFWGVGVHNDITTASVLALISAVNQALDK